jgi:hypothetical protein
MTAEEQQAKPFAYDVFLSHSSADKPRVRRLAERLRAASSDFVLRTSDIGPRTS